jgi:hypothetical protein
VLTGDREPQRRSPCPAMARPARVRAIVVGRALAYALSSWRQIEDVPEAAASTEPVQALPGAGWESAFAKGMVDAQGDLLPATPTASHHRGPPVLGRAS